MFNPLPYRIVFNSYTLSIYIYIYIKFYILWKDDLKILHIYEFYIDTNKHIFFCSKKKGRSLYATPFHNILLVVIFIHSFIDLPKTLHVYAFNVLFALFTTNIQKFLLSTHYVFEKIFLLNIYKLEYALRSKLQYVLVILSFFSLFFWRHSYYKFVSQFTA